MNKRGVLLLSGAGAGMMLLDLHKVGIAVPSIERALQPGPVGIQLVHAAYVVCFALTLVPAGRIGDHGHRIRLVHTGLALYLLGSVLCAAAPAVEVLIAGRALTGVAAGILMPQMMGLVQGLFSPEERGKAFGTYGVVISLSTALGPTVGGLLMTLGGPDNGWRGIFLMNLPVGIGLAVAAWRLLPAVAQAGTFVPRRTRVDIDVVSLLVGGLALLCLLTPFILTTGRPGDVAARWLLLVPALLLAVSFVSLSRRRTVAGKTPLIDTDLLRIRSFRNGVLVSLTWFASGPGFALGLTIYLQEALGWSPFLAGVVLLPSSAASAYGALIGGRLVVRHGRLLTAVGMVLVSASMLATLLVMHASEPGTIIPAVALLQVVAGFGGGFVVSPNHSMTLMEVPPGKGGAASALGQLGQRTSNSVGVAAAGVAYFATIYGAGYALPTAPAHLHLQAFDRTTLVACGFLALALAVVVADWRRQVRARVAEPVGVA